MLPNNIIYWLVGAVAIVVALWFFIDFIRGLVNAEGVFGELELAKATGKKMVINFVRDGREVKKEMYCYVCSHCGHISTAVLCPECGGKLEINKKTEVVKCSSCGFRADVMECQLCHEVIWQN